MKIDGVGKILERAAFQQAASPSAPHQGPARAARASASSEVAMRGAGKPAITSEDAELFAQVTGYKVEIRGDLIVVTGPGGDPPASTAEGRAALGLALTMDADRRAGRFAGKSMAGYLSGVYHSDDPKAMQLPALWLSRLEHYAKRDGEKPDLMR